MNGLEKLQPSGKLASDLLFLTVIAIGLCIETLNLQQVILLSILDFFFVLKAYGEKHNELLLLSVLLFVHNCKMQYIPLNAILIITYVLARFRIFYRNNK